MLSSLILISCSNKIYIKKKPDTFYETVEQFSGKKYPGNIVFPAGEEAPFRGEPLWVEVNKTSRNRLEIPVHVGNNIYRTLIFGKDKNGYWLQHENKRPDGAQAEISMYGGRNEEETNNYVMVFPADGYTKQLLGAARNSTWSLGLSSDKHTLSYIAEDDGRLVLQIDIDLAEALQ
ncbi:hypothetical protein [Adhaeribacter aquaticus]|uniref:hypothetical protein n=1 Tax=Adhaeribacter aquaticus TaxID=299567 RepID=UPI00042A0E5A|nr:hypothetical protein [Adhaeribacter aquaticus]